MFTELISGNLDKPGKMQRDYLSAKLLHILSFEDLCDAHICILYQMKDLLIDIFPH